METQEPPAPPATSAKFVEDLNQRFFEFLAQAQRQFRTTGLVYSEKLHQYFVDLGSDAESTATEIGEAETEGPGDN